MRTHKDELKTKARVASLAELLRPAPTSLGQQETIRGSLD
jgi:hypothetical protein